MSITPTPDRASTAGQQTHQQPLRPTETALQVKREVLSQQEVLRDVLDETLTSAEDGDIKESGRTFCPDSALADVLGPARRFPRSVRLRSCPSGASGIVHTHVTHGELLTPEHSLPDMANVLYSDLDASVVLGTDSADVLLAPTNEEQAMRAFEEALGVSIHQPGDVVDAIHDGQIQDPPAARRRIRGRLAPLFQVEGVNFPGMRQRAHALHSEGVIAAAPVHSDGTFHGCYAHHVGGGDRRFHGARARFREHVHEVSEPSLYESGSDMDWMQMAVGAAVGTVAGSLVEWAIFGNDPRDD